MLEVNDLVLKYNKLNNSYKKTLVFHIGAEAGFFSEYNNMILAMLYCLKHEIKFVLFSQKSNFGFKDGWSDYFQPFCSESKSIFHLKYNGRNKSKLRRDRIITNLYKLINNVDYLTYDLWNLSRNREIETEKYNIPELNITGDLHAACRALVNLTWNYNEPAKKIIREKIKSLKLPDSYLGFHIRMGDKYMESDLKAADEYISKAQALSDLRTAFVLTDDYRVIDLLEENFREWTFYTLCEKDERGYFHEDFQKEDKGKIKESYLKLFASVDVLSRSELFIGTFSSNPGMYLGMRMEAGKSVGIDLEKWQIW